MDVGVRKLEPSLPPDYVSLAQLQDRWLKKQDEKKLKQKLEEEEKRDAERKLKQKQEEEEKRERDARAAAAAAQDEKNQRGRGNDGRAKIVGGFVREKGVVQDKGKGKETVSGGPVIGRENDHKRNRKHNFKRDAAVKSMGEIGVDAKELRVGDTVRAGISSGGVAGVGGGLIGVEEKRSVSVEVFPRNSVKEEIADVKRIDLRGGLRGNGRNPGSRTVIELKQSEMALDLEKKMEVQKGNVSKWREKPINRGYPERLNVNHALEKKTGDNVSQVHSELSSSSVGDRNGIRGRSSNVSNKAEEDRVEGEGSNGDEVALGIEKQKEGEKGYGWRGRAKWKARGKWRYGGYSERINRFQEHMPVVLEGIKVDPELEKKAEEGISEVSSEIKCLSVGDRNGIQEQNSNGRNKAKEDRVEGEDGDKVVLEIQKKMEGEKGYGWRGRGRNRGYPGRLNRFQEHRSVVLEGNKVDTKLEKKAGDEVSEVSIEISRLRAGDRNGIPGQSINGSSEAEEDIVKGEGSNGDKVVLEIEKIEGEKGYGGRGKGGGRWTGGRGGRNRVYSGRLNRFQEHMSVVLEGNKVDTKLEKKAGDEVSEFISEISGLRAEDRNGIRGQSSNGSNQAEEDIVKGEGSNGDKVVLEIEKMEGEKGYGGRGKGGGRWTGRSGGRNEDHPERFNMFQEYRPVVLEGNKVDSELEKKAGNEVSKVSSETNSLSVGDRDGIQGGSRNDSNKAEDDRGEGEGSNGDKVLLKNEKKMECGKGYGGRVKNVGYPVRFNRFQEHRPVVLEGNKVYSELGEKAGDRNGIRGEISTGSSKAEENRVEGEASIGDKGALEIEKKVDHEVLAGESARKGETRGFVNGYQRYRNRGRDFDWGRRDTRPEISDRLRELNSGKTGTVWVIKEKKVGA